MSQADLVRRRRAAAHQRLSQRGRAVWRIVFGTFGAVFVLCTSFLGASTAAAYAAFNQITQDLPAPELLTQRPQYQTAKIFDRNGVLLYELSDPEQGKRIDVSLQSVPLLVRRAFLAAEDARFYDNPGFDVRAMLRALQVDLVRHSDGGPVVGGSTITQQLVKNALVGDERSLTRKIREAVLAYRVTQRYSKDQILEMYLNSAAFGNQAYGIQAAAETYFGKSATELTLGEGALLAGVLPSPSTTNPLVDYAAAKAEQRRVLDSMVHHEMLSDDEAEAAYAASIELSSHETSDLKAPHFVFWVRDQLEAKYGKGAINERGLRVTTTLDYQMQEMAELIVRQRVGELAGFNVSDGALVALNPATGEVLAMAGSADYTNKAIHGEVNVALSLRQPGSSIKPVTYLAAFLKGWSPATVIEDAPTDFPQGVGMPPYRPKNYDGAFHGKVTARAALANSYNIPAVKALQFTGIPGMIDLAKRMGITSFGDPEQYGLAITLGGGEVRLLDLTGAYGVLATGGRRVAPTAILRVDDAAGHIVDQYTPRPQPVVDAAHAYLVTSILSDNDARTPAFGANSPLKLSRPAAVKTGTTDDYKDNWTVGYTSQLVTGVWVGNADGTPMRGTTGITGAAPIWHDFMEYALAPLPVDLLAPPSGLQRVTVGRTSGKLWVEGCPEPKQEDYFVSGAAPRETCAPPTATAIPTGTAAPPSWLATSEPRATSTPGPTLDELRERAAATATSGAVAFATRYAETQARYAANPVPASQAPSRAATTPLPTRSPVPSASTPYATPGPGSWSAAVDLAGVRATSTAISVSYAATSTAWAQRTPYAR